jgi:di/tricarboxylate transporter
MGTEAVIVLVVLALVFTVLVRDLVSPPAAMLAAVVVLVLTRVIDPATGFAGFASPATLTVAGLFVVARAIRDHVGLDDLIARGLKNATSDRAALARLLAPVAMSSAVIANTPIVATTAPMVRTWAERDGRSPSRFLMPLSFASIVGGVVTTIGTSTTLVVSGLVARSGHEPFGLLEVAPVGVPVAIVGVALITLLAPKLLPDRRSAHEAVAGAERDYTIRFEVHRGGPWDGRAVGDGLRHLDEVYLAAIERVDGTEVAPVAPTKVLHSGDVVTFVGQVDRIRQLWALDGMGPVEAHQAAHLDGKGHGLVEVVVGASSPLVGRTAKEVSFRGRYGAAVLAVHRAGQRVEGKIGEVRLQSGDALLLLTDDQFPERWRDRSDFAIVVDLDRVGPGATSRRPLVVATVGAMLAVAALGVLPIFEAVLAACLVLVGSRCLSFHGARQALDLDVLLIIASAIGLGAAVEVSGLADVIAANIEVAAVATGSLVALALVVIGTLVLTEIVTNVAAAALMVPIALGVADRVGADPIGFAVAVAVAASASFLTPVGYQTNTIVYGLGGYRFGDYWRLGLPLTLAVIVLILTVVPVVWPWPS